MPHDIPLSTLSPKQTGLGRMKMSDLLVSILMCGVIAVFCWGTKTMFPSQLSERNTTPMPMRQVDAMIVLAGAQERWTYAQALFSQGHALQLLSTHYDPICLRVGQLLEGCPTGVRNTVDEAVTMRRVLEREHIRSTTIVTSEYHALRTAAIFAVVFAGSGIDFSVVGAPASDASQSRFLLRELVKLGPSIAGAIVARYSPPLYESLLSLRER